MSETRVGGGESECISVDVRGIAKPVKDLKSALEYIKELKGGESWTTCAKVCPKLLDTLAGALEEVIILRGMFAKAKGIDKARGKKIADDALKQLKEADPKIGMAIETHVLGGTPPTASEISDQKIGAAVEKNTDG